MNTPANTHPGEPDVAIWLYLQFLREAHANNVPITLSPDESWLLQEIAIRKVTEASQIYPVFRELFKKEGAAA